MLHFKNVSEQAMKQVKHDKTLEDEDNTKYNKVIMNLKDRVHAHRQKNRNDNHDPDNQD